MLEFFPLPKSAISMWEFLKQPLPECRSLPRKDGVLGPSDDLTHETSKTAESIFPSTEETIIVSTEELLTEAFETALKSFIVEVTGNATMYEPHTYTHPLHNEQAVA